MRGRGCSLRDRATSARLCLQTYLVRQVVFVHLPVVDLLLDRAGADEAEDAHGAALAEPPRALARLCYTCWVLCVGCGWFGGGGPIISKE